MGKKKRGSNRMEGSSLKSLQDAVSDDEGEIAGEDGIYGEVDLWEKDQEKELLETMKIGRHLKGDSGPNEILALSGTDSDSDLELPTIKSLRKKQKAKDKESSKIKAAGNDEPVLGNESAEDDSSSDEDDENDDSRRWGSKKKYYYGGNTGEEVEHELGDSDLEEDKIEEQEAAKLQARQLEMMDEEDFLDTFVIKKQESNKTPKEPLDKLTRDLSKLSRKEQVALFKQQSPEFEGIVADFQLRMGDAIKLAKITSMAAGGEIPDGPVLTYIRNKLELLLNYCTNIIAYLMFKSQGVHLALHPVTGRLVQYRQLIDRLEEKDKIVMPQVNDVLSRVEKGEIVKQMVKEERRKFRKEHERKNTKPLKFKELKDDVNETSNKKKKRKQKKRKAESELAGLEGLTGDERIAVEMYQAMKKSKTVEDFEDDESLDENEKEVAEEHAPENENNIPLNDIENEEEAEKRAITYTIAKNKGLMPKRSKLQRNPRVKNRMKFEKAKKRRKGAVREIRDQKHKYSGEASGMNIRVKKGVKIS